MTYVMALVKIGDNPDQNPWLMATFAEDPRKDGLKIGDEYQFDDEPDEKWRIEDIFRGQG
jgi:hypothetical protein